MPPSPSSTHNPASEDVRLWVSDLYLAAFLLSKGVEPLFVRFEGEGVHASLAFKGPAALLYRKAYAAGEVLVSLPALRQKLNRLRDLLHHLAAQHPEPFRLIPLARFPF